MLGPEVVAISATAVAIVLLFIRYRDAKECPERLLPTWNEPRGLGVNIQDVTPALVSEFKLTA